MTAHTLEAGMPALFMIGGYELRLEAINPTTGDAVADVTVSNVVINADDVGDADVGTSGPFFLTPGPGAGGGEPPADEFV